MVTWCRKIGALGISLSLVAGIAAVSGATTTKQTVAMHAIKDEVAVYNAFKTFSIKAARLTDTSTAAQIEAVAAPLGSAFKVLRGELVTGTWPSGAQGPVSLVDSALTPLIADMALAGHLSSAGASSNWISKTNSDIDAWVGDLNVVNHVLDLPPFTTNGTAVSACQADGATVAVALAAFQSTNPGITPTEALLTRKGHGGPFIVGWPHRVHYSFSLNRLGKLMIAVPPVANPVSYRGPSSCAAAGV
jgi:hypothetical protein